MAQIDKDIYEALLASLKEEMPGFEIRYKDESLLMRIIGVPMRLFNGGFMKTYTTTIGRKVYYPSRAFEATYPWRVLAHEGVHARDARDHWYFKLTYLSPQVFCVVATLLAIVFHSLIGVAAALLLLAPLPSPGRRHWEERGYLMTGCCDAIMGGRGSVLNDAYVTWMVNHYTTGAYYWMSWSKSGTHARVISDMGLAGDLVTRKKVMEPYSKTIDLIESIVKDERVN